MANELKRATGLLIIEVVNSNANGDPDRESDPRQRPNGLGEISPVSFKRKLRDLLEDSSSPFFQSLPEKFKANAEHYQILEHRGRDRAAIMKEMTSGGELTEFGQEKFLESPFVKKYWDARHNCYVYSVGKNREYTRCSDDGEPSGTAGRPMLDVILGEDIYNVAAVVTRYFGGILLGTGGLVRAYSRSLQEGLAASTVIEKTYGISMEVVTDYTGIGKIQYIAGEQKLPILDSEYTDRVVLHLLVPADQIAFVEKAITEGTNGRAKMKKEKDLYYSVIDGEVKVFTD